MSLHKNKLKQRGSAPQLASGTMDATKLKNMIDTFVNNTKIDRIQLATILKFLADLAGVGGGSGANLTYDAGTRTIASDTGTDAILPLAAALFSGDAGLMSGLSNNNLINLVTLLGAAIDGNGVIAQNLGTITQPTRTVIPTATPDVKEAIQDIVTFLQTFAGGVSYANYVPQDSSTITDGMIVSTGDGGAGNRIEVVHNPTTGVFQFNIPAGIEPKRIVLQFASSDTDDVGLDIFLSMVHADARYYNTDYDNLLIPSGSLMAIGCSAPSRSTPYDITFFGRNTNDKQLGVSAAPGGGTGSDVEFRINDAAVGLNNIMVLEWNHI